MNPIGMSFSGVKSGGKLDSYLNASGAENWGLDISDKSYLDLFDKPKSDFVYLTPDSPNNIETFDPSKVYIIGGIVDHNQKKGVCYERALEQGIAHGKFPIKENISLGDYSTTLTTNNCVSLILKFIETQEWRSALEAVLPKRKTAKRQGLTAKQSMQEAKRKKSDE